VSVIWQACAQFASAVGLRQTVLGIRNKYSRLIREPLLRAALRQQFTATGTLPSICLSGDFSGSTISRLARTSFEDALNNKSKLSQAIRDIEGMSGQKYRSFINNFICGLTDARYLEIGSWMGSTVAAALYGDTARALCIDNWSQFGGSKAQFDSNLELVRSKDVHIDLVEQDFHTVDFSSMDIFNVYLFDGPHGEFEQYDGITLPQPALTSPCLVTVDDWNWLQVRIGTFRALKDAKCRIECSIEVRTTLDNTTPELCAEVGDGVKG